MGKRRGRPREASDGELAMNRVYYLGEPVTQLTPVVDGWCWCLGQDGRRWKHWAAQLTVTP